MPKMRAADSVPSSSATPITASSASTVRWRRRHAPKVAAAHATTSNEPATSEPSTSPGWMSALNDSVTNRHGSSCRSNRSRPSHAADGRLVGRREVVPQRRQVAGRVHELVDDRRDPEHDEHRDTGQHPVPHRSQRSAGPSSPQRVISEHGGREEREAGDQPDVGDVGLHRERSREHADRDHHEIVEDDRPHREQEDEPPHQREVRVPRQRQQRGPVARASAARARTRCRAPRRRPPRRCAIQSASPIAIVLSTTVAASIAQADAPNSWYKGQIA